MKTNPKALLPAFILDSVLDSLGGDRPLPLTKRHRNDLATLVIVARELVEVLQRVLATGQNEHEGPAGYGVLVARVQTEWRRIDEARSDLIAHKLLHAHVHLAGLQNLQQRQLLELVEPVGRRIESHKMLDTIIKGTRIIAFASFQNSLQRCIFADHKSAI